MKIKLNKPILFGNDTINEIVILEPRACDLDGIDFKDLTQATVLRKLISRCSGVPDAALKELSFSDFMTCVEAISDFLGLSPATTKTGKDSLPQSSTSSQVN